MKLMDSAGDFVAFVVDAVDLFPDMTDLLVLCCCVDKRSVDNEVFVDAGTSNSTVRHHCVSVGSELLQDPGPLMNSFIDRTQQYRNTTFVGKIVLKYVLKDRKAKYISTYICP